MADETQVPGSPIPPEAPTTTAPSTSSVDPSEYEALQNEAAQMRQAFAMLDPHSERIRRLVEDPQAAALFDDALSAYENFEKRRAPKVPDELNPIYEKVSKLETFVDRYEQQQKDAAERPQREFQGRYVDWQNSPTNNRFFTRLMADHPELQSRDIQYLAQCAVEKNFEPLEETWKREGWRFTKPGTSAPPASLRTDAGEVGIPGESQRGAPAQNGPSMRQRIVELERARRGIA